MIYAIAFGILALLFALALYLKNRLNHYCDSHWDWTEFRGPMP